jgi:hypothetical protein
MADNCVLKLLFLYRFVTVAHSVQPCHAGHCTLSDPHADVVLGPIGIPEKLGIIQTGINKK